jgi:hypothetical protein
MADRKKAMKKKKTLSGKARRIKGHDWEREVAKWFRSLYPGAKRGYQARGDSKAADVTGVPFWLECKCQERIQLLRWWRQAEEDSGQAEPALCIKKPGSGDVGEALFVVSGSYFKGILKAATEHAFTRDFVVVHNKPDRSVQGGEDPGGAPPTGEEEG